MIVATMATTINNPNSLGTLFREDVVIALNTRLAAGSTIANPLFRLRNATTTLVDIPLNATTPLTVGGSDGSATLNPTGPGTAVAGTATSPDGWQLVGRDNTVHLSGTVTSNDGITTGQQVTAGTITLTMPAS
jgi:hypothetical protein